MQNSKSISSFRIASDTAAPPAQDSRPLLYLEDVALGQRFTTASQLLDAAAIQTFAAQFDPQPFHLSEDAAERSLFRGLVASGWHTAAVSMRLMVGGGPRVAGGLIGGSCELRWPQPTRPGDILHVESEIVTITPSRSRPDRGMITLRSETRNQRGEIVQIWSANVVMIRRPAPRSKVM